jgi:hypothetical protein
MLPLIYLLYLQCDIKQKKLLHFFSGTPCSSVGKLCLMPIASQCFSKIQLFRLPTVQQVDILEFERAFGRVGK